MFPVSLLRREGGGGGGDGGGGKGVRAMSNQSVEEAKSVAFNLDYSVSEFVFAQAVERLKALQTAAHALDTRITQVATLQFTAAAIAANLIPNGKAASLTCALISMLAFIVGGIFAFRGVRSDAIHLPGLPPAWWIDATQEDEFTDKTALCWAAGVYQGSIDDVEAENAIRSKALNMSLVYAVAGAGFVTLAAAFRGA